MSKVTICIPTFRRPQGLAKALEAVARLETAHDVRVIVADNDAEGRAGFALCEQMKPAYRWPLDSVVVSARGIAQNRNALVEQAMRDPQMEYLVMFDDDEWPVSGWLDALIDTQRATSADAVAGSVQREFEVPPGRLANHCDGICEVRGKTGPAHEIDSTANVLICRSILNEGRRFDLGFALTGGEDREFFTGMARDGKRFAFSDEAVVYAYVPASRGSLKWGLQRAYRAGNSDMRVMLKYGLSVRQRMVETAKIVGAILTAPFAIVLFAANARRAADAIRRVFRASGKLAAVFGSHYNEYAVTHGK
ncbi:MAG TPA: glycosyltransferase family A protein [Rhizomicrobium sp.]|jgi:glycosyltransferase involved in cell wall biosynthesis|nr:glycosyltransferase family A protein [Rhizomicrobium sp.]